MFVFNQIIFSPVQSQFILCSKYSMLHLKAFLWLVFGWIENRFVLVWLTFQKEVNQGWRMRWAISHQKTLMCNQTLDVRESTYWLFWCRVQCICFVFDGKEVRQLNPKVGLLQMFSPARQFEHEGQVQPQESIANKGGLTLDKALQFTDEK